MTSLKRIILVAMAALMLPLLAESKVYLVSVGIADYKGTEMDLRLSADDARTITWLYSQNNDLQYVQLLNEKATISSITAAMNKVFANAGVNDIVVFFYSGHGFPGGFNVYDGKLTYDTVRKAMSRSNCRNKMIFADACFAGAIRNGGGADQASVASAKKANVMLFLSSRSNEVSWEGARMKNGFFTTYLQKGLRGGADADRNRVITAKELFDYVHTNVSKKTDDKQHPVMWGNFPDDMPVMRW